jgi:hypothetical protein
MTDRASDRSKSTRHEREPRRDITPELIGLVSALVYLVTAVIERLG